MTYTSGDDILDNHYNDFSTSINSILSTASAGAQVVGKVSYVAAADTSIPSSQDIVNGTLTTTMIERDPSTANLADTCGNPSFTTVTNTQS